MKPSITLNGHAFTPLIPHSKIIASIERLADEIDGDFKDKPVTFLVVLKGAFMFAAELMQAMKKEVEVEFIRVKSYEGKESSGQIQSDFGALDLKGKSVVIVEDIVDTGTTLEFLNGALQKMGVMDIKVATLFFKPQTYQKDLPIDYVGIELKDQFVVGFGLDFDEAGRTLPDLYVEANEM